MCFSLFAFTKNTIANNTATAIPIVLPICDGNLNPLYADGISVLTLTFPRDEGCTFDSFIGMDCPPPNWNEGLDPELTKDLHLISQFHNLFQHMLFAITDFIYVRKFKTEIKVEIMK